MHILAWINVLNSRESCGASEETSQFQLVNFIREMKFNLICLGRFNFPLSFDLQVEIQIARKSSLL